MFFRGVGLQSILRALVFAIVAIALASTGRVASAAPGATISGRLVLPAASKRPSPPVKSTGFVQRVAHPLLTGKPMENPYPSMFVVLSGGTPDDAGTKPSRRPVDLLLIGQRFERHIFPALVGQMVLLKNTSTQTSNRGVTPRIDAPGHRDIFANPSDAGNPLNPNGERELTLKEPFTPIELRDLDQSHIKTTLIGIPHKYFAVPKSDGRFDITGVPAGSWTARVWYDTGWLDGADTVVQVPVRGKKSITIRIPPAMSVKAPAVK